MYKFISELQSAIKLNKSHDIIKKYESKLANCIEEVFQLKEFFQLPLNNILNVIKESDFSNIDDQVPIIQTIIQNTVEFYPNSAALLLHSFDLDESSISFQDCMGLIQCFSTCKLCKILGNLFQEYQQIPERDFSCEIAQKDKLIKEYRIQLGLQPPPEKTPFPILTIVPDKFCKSQFEAAKSGNLKSLQYFLEVLHTNKEMTMFKYKHGTESNPRKLRKFGPNYRIQIIHIACLHGNFPIVKYLVEQQKVYVNTPLFNGVTPLHIACAYGYFSIVQFLVEYGANIEATEKRYNETPLFAAYHNLHMHVVDYLISKGANINHKNKNGYKADQQKEIIKTILKIQEYWNLRSYIMKYWEDDSESFYQEHGFSHL